MSGADASLGDGSVAHKDTGTQGNDSGMQDAATQNTNDSGTQDAGGSDSAPFMGVDSGPGNCPSRPALTPGVWKSITPAGLNLPKSPPPYGLAYVEIDPTDPCTLYITCDEAGAWKTTNGGSSWLRLGDPAHTGSPTTQYLDSPIAIRVDPNNNQHLYATQGVRGATLGFWVSTDGGNNWTQPQGFITVSATTTQDVTTLAVDPADFKHVLVGSHGTWPGLSTSGILESKDGGSSWIVHPPTSDFTFGSMGIHFLYNPALGIGNGQTWLVGTDGNGMFRTTDSGAHFTRVAPASFGITHGGQQIFYASDGTLYAGGFVYPVRSTNNGLSWTSLTNLPYAYYYSIVGDGKTLYTQISYTGDNGGKGPQPYLVSPETDGLTWTPYLGASSSPQTFNDGPFLMRFDANNRILYSANWDSGLWALKVMP